MWPDRRLLDLFKIEYPIVLAPMAGAVDAALVIAVAEAGGLGSLPVAMLNEQQMRAQMEKIPRRHAQAGQSEFLLSYPAGAQQCARACLARGAQALLRGTWHRPGGAGAVEQPHAVRCGPLRGGRGDSSRKW